MHPSALRAFLTAFDKVVAGETGLWRENEIDAIQSVPAFEQLAPVHQVDPELLRKLAVIKLNGGLGTGMGLESAKSLLIVKGANNFLDFIVQQILILRAKTGGTAPAFYLMNSSHTRQDTLE